MMSDFGFSFGELFKFPSWRKSLINTVYYIKYFQTRFRTLNVHFQWGTKCEFCVANGFPSIFSYKQTLELSSDFLTK